MENLDDIIMNSYQNINLKTQNTFSESISLSYYYSIIYSAVPYKELCNKERDFIYYVLDSANRAILNKFIESCNTSSTQSVVTRSTDIPYHDLGKFEKSINNSFLYKAWNIPNYIKHVKLERFNNAINKATAYFRYYLATKNINVPDTLSVLIPQCCMIALPKSKYNQLKHKVNKYSFNSWAINHNVDPNEFIDYTLLYEGFKVVSSVALPQELRDEVESLNSVFIFSYKPIEKLLEESNDNK